MGEYDHVWFWRTKLPERKGQPCRVVTRGRMNSILVEFEEGEATFDHFMELIQYLEDLLRRRVDLVTTRGLSPYLRPTIEKEVIWCEG